MSTQLNLGTTLQQKLNMQMIQNLELMALPLTELQQKVSDMVLANPVLEMQTKEEGSDLAGSDDSAYDKDESDMLDTPEAYEGHGDEASDRALEALENNPGCGESLQDHLLGQLHLEKLSEKEMLAGEILISDLDGNGFWSRDPDEVLPSYLLCYKKKVISILQGLDPVGCAVPSWRESLVAQGRDKHLKEEELALLEKLTQSDRALELMAMGKVENAASMLSYAKEDLQAIFTFMKSLTLYPGRGFSDDFTSTITVDLRVHAEGDSLTLEINDEAIPTLTLDPQYLAMAKESKDATTKSYLSEHIRDAKNLISQIGFRHANLERLGKQLCLLQKEFFFKGTRYLKPLSQKQMAEKLDVSEGTVSRLVANKYIETDWGVLSLKSLFPGGVGGESKNSVMEMIREIVAHYEGKKKISDQKISEILAGKGISIARRTVAKYRSQMEG